MKILLIEDDLEIAQLYEKALVESGHLVTVLSEGTGVLREVKSEQANYELILLDIMLPNKSGLDVLRELKSDPTTQQIPVYMLTVLDQKQIIEQAKKRGADGYITKTNHTPEQVAKKVNQLSSSG